MGFEKMCCCKNTINSILHIIALIVLIIGLWTHSWLLIIFAIIIALVGHIVQALQERSRKQVVIPKKKRRR